VSVVVVGAGQAGLSVSHELTARGVEHVVLERGKIGQTWRGRWDTFCLVTPNWTVQLPGGRYDGNDPDGFMPRDEIVRHLERYGSSFRAPVREGVTVRSLERADHGFVLRTTEGDLDADVVVLTTGAYQRPYRPAAAAAIPAGVDVRDAEGYANPGDLPPGRIVVVGSGQTGCQLAEELRESGRDVVLSCGRAPWMPRRASGRDFVAWIEETPFMEQTRAALPPQGRLLANPQCSGKRGGHDLNYRTLRALGVTLVGHLAGVEGRALRFAPDLAASVAFGDQLFGQLRTLILDGCRRKGIVPPDLRIPEPFTGEGPERVGLDGVGTVIFTSGFRPDYASWVRIDGAFDELGFPLETDGASSAAPGLFFCGVHFMRKRRSSLLFGVGEDAAVVAGGVAEAVSAVA